MAYRQGVVLVLMGAGVCHSALAETGLSTSLELGYRVDSLDWNIAGDTSGQNPNILSELSWDHLVIPQVRIKLDGQMNDLHLLGEIAYGEVSDGDNQDSDYIFDNRQGEFSRSNNRAGGVVKDGTIGIGYRFATGVEGTRSSFVMPMAGYSIHQQNMKMTDGYQTVDLINDPPVLEPFPGLDSSYDAEWQSGWLGVRLVEADAKEDLSIGMDIIYHWADYQAEANWNLRTDFAHPKSFQHDAKGNGLVFSLNSVAKLSKRWDWIMGFDYSAWRAKPGVDTVYVVDEGDGSVSIAQTRLNEVNWESLAINLGVMLRL